MLGKIRMWLLAASIPATILRWPGPGRWDAASMGASFSCIGRQEFTCDLESPFFWKPGDREPGLRGRSARPFLTAQTPTNSSLQSRNWVSVRCFVDLESRHDRRIRTMCRISFSAAYPLSRKVFTTKSEGHGGGLREPVLLLPRSGALSSVIRRAHDRAGERPLRAVRTPPEPLPWRTVYLRSVSPGRLECPVAPRLSAFPTIPSARRG